ncbi:hypothetical protein MD484_g744, partial [Candolleomyces efflorescens]
MAEKAPLPATRLQYDDQFTVHNYTSLPSKSPAGPSTAQLLSTAQDLIKACSSRYNNPEWRAMSRAKPFVWAPKNLYVYSSPLPKVTREERAHVEELKEWGSSVEESEIWALVDLEEFQSTDFSSLLQKESLPRSQESKKRLRSPEKEQQDTGCRPPEAKRRKLDEGPLHGVIPRPHLLPSRLVGPATLHTKSKPYTKTSPIILPPFTSPLPQPSLHDRRAWIIPVRGVIPWQGSSPAETLQELEEKPIPPTPRSLEPVFWSHKALKSFWDWLRILRDGGKAGTLGISFHAAARTRNGGPLGSTSNGHGGGDGAGSTWEARAQNQNLLLEGGAQRLTMDATTTTGVADGTEITTKVKQPTLSTVDYIKIHHDALGSMNLRSVLDAWAYEIKDGQGALVEKIRVLQGAKLVLMDNLSRGVLIS